MAATGQSHIVGKRGLKLALSISAGHSETTRLTRMLHESTFTLSPQEALA
jgi:hypothetical protein